MAKDFVEKTGVDALAIAVGNAHGAYKLPPKLDFERIRTIANTVDVPLVLHGGSGLTDNDFKRASLPQRLPNTLRNNKRKKPRKRLFLIFANNCLLF
jgi:hypothetical protein